MIKDISQIKECPDCASSNIVHSESREQVICRECGLIFEPLAPVLEEKYEKAHKMARAPERRAKKAKPKKSKR